MTRSQKALLFGTPVLVIVAISLAAAMRHRLSVTAAIAVFFVVYWCGCWLLTLLLVPIASVKRLYSTPVAPGTRERLLTWLPPLLTCIVVFIPSAPLLPIRYLLAIVVFAVANGVTEELFWRGTFSAVWKQSLTFAYIYPCVLFTVLHVALVFLPGVEYQGGGGALVGGAAVMAFLWGWVVFRFHDLRSVTFAHILTNIFAFSGLILQNWVTRQPV